MQMSPRTPFRGRLLCNSKSRSNRCGFSFYIKKLDILMSSFPVYLQYYLINDTADGSVIGVVASRTGIIFIDSITGPAVIMVVVKVRTDVSG